MTELKGFIDREGRIILWPAKEVKRKLAAGYLASKFEQGKSYTEKEVGQLLTDWHCFQDVAFLRRDLVDRGLIHRENDGSRYWKSETDKLP